MSNRGMFTCTEFYLQQYYRTDLTHRAIFTILSIIQRLFYCPIAHMQPDLEASKTKRGIKKEAGSSEPRNNSGAN